MAERTVSVRLKAEAGQYMATMRAAGAATKDLEKASRVLSTAMDNEENAAGRVRVAEAQLLELKKSGKTTDLQLARARETLAMATRKYAAAQERTRAATEQWVAAQKRANDEQQRTGESLRDVEKIAKRTQFQFKALAAAIAVGGPAAAAAALGVAAVGAVGAFTTLGAVALRNNAEVRQSFADLAFEVRTGITQDAAPMADAFVGAADQMRGAYQGLRPELRGIFADSATYVEPLTDGVIDLAYNAMPGLSRAVSEAGPIVDGFGALLGDVGSGLGSLMDEAASHTDAVGEGLEHLGSLVDGTLTETGDLLGHLSELWAEHGDEVADVVTRIIGVLEGLTGSALPVLSTTAGAALNVLSGLLSAIEPMVDVLGPAIGWWLSLAGAIKAVNAVQGVAAKVASGMSGIGGAMDRSGSRAAAFKSAALGAALVLGQLALQAQAINPDVEKLGDSMLKWASTGRIGGEAARVFGSNLQDLDYAVTAVTDGGLTRGVAEVAEFAGGLVGLKGPLSEAKEQIGGLDQALAEMVDDEGIGAAHRVVQQIAEQTGRSIDEVVAALPKYQAAVDAAKDRMKQLGTSGMQATPGIKELEESLATLGDETAAVEDRVDALNSAWRRLFGVALTMEEATSAFEGGLDEIRTSLEGVKGSSASWRAELLNANGSINLTTEAGRNLSEQLIQQGEDYRALAITAYDTARQQGLSQEQATARAVAATNNRRQQFIREMRQMGLNADQARTLANRYFGIPEDVLTFIKQHGMAAARGHARGYKSELDAIPEQVTTTYTKIMETIVSPTKGGVQPLEIYGWNRRDGGIVPGFASGGLPRPRPGMFRGVGGPREDANLVAISDGEFITNAADTMRNRAALEAGNRGARLVALGPGGVVAGLAGGGAVRQAPRALLSGGPSVVVNVSIPNYVGNRAELTRALRREIADGFGGDVQKALGKGKGR
ncbi:hypothetical protein [Prauserella muralis]|uniref:Uncharacterized protein n=1 Tax=Prauserella muralis TaxID=588067 RepID=A0A2V4AP13_9PSEU|nr:hypothetical protein [Prauserella muralis]PXY20876.1 hypothetical protein BAY60_25570 [Prauserella muralis]TWE29916.1 hypothetical protein FHX69_2609 [Prauserella muralis]